MVVGRGRVVVVGGGGRVVGGVVGRVVSGGGRVVVVVGAVGVVVVDDDVVVVDGLAWVPDPDQLPQRPPCEGALVRQPPPPGDEVLELRPEIEHTRRDEPSRFVVCDW